MPPCADRSATSPPNDPEREDSAGRTIAGMPEMQKYDPGTPCWVDLGSRDLEASKSFYGQLFGWEAETAPDPEAGGYTMFKLRGNMVAAVGPLMDENQPPSWTTYVSVDDADKTAAMAKEAGG